jgi:hypothetical protein
MEPDGVALAVWRVGYSESSWGIIDNYLEDGMVSEAKAEVYVRYPVSSLLVYNGVTVLHFLLGGIGIMVGYKLSWTGYLFGSLYLIFAFGQMYVMMPLTVCPNCLYYRMENALCTSGLNAVSKKIAREGDPELFSSRAKGLLCHNNLYMAALFIPIVALIPALFINFTFLLLIILLAVVGLLLFRLFVIFGRMACLHCSAKYECPNAAATGVRER